MTFKPGLEHRDTARQAIKDLHRQLLNARLAEGHDMTTAIKLASDDLQEAIQKGHGKGGEQTCQPSIKKF